MLYILLVNKERDLSFTLYLLQVLNFYCPRLLSAMMQVFTLPLHACEGVMSRFYKLLVWSLGKHSLHCILEHKHGQGFTSFPSSSTSAEYDGDGFSAGSAP